MKDTFAREYANLSHMKVGTRLQADRGFECIEHDAILTVSQDDRGFYVPCACGKHYLDGQLDFDDKDSLIGLYPVSD